MVPKYTGFLLLTIAAYLLQLPVTVEAFCIPQQTKARQRCIQTILSSSKNSEESDEDNNPKIAITSFDQAGASLIEEEDRKRMEAMGDFDANPNSSSDSVERMRAAIRARTADLGLEKSKVSADYIEQRKAAALEAGSARAANENSEVFGGLDLSQIRSTRIRSPQEDEELPSMFFDPDEQLSDEEKAEVDPLLNKNLLEQGLYEISQVKWPDWTSALREVGLLAVVVAITAVIIIGWDKLIRSTYTDVLHLIPSKEDLANYANRFDGLDLPKGWMDNMNEQDVASFAEKISKGSLPEL